MLAIETRPFRGWIPVAALLLAALYLPTLTTPFDFIDDGNLVYPADPMPIDARLHLVWQKIVANYDDLGPFRPVLWVHWELEADLFGASPVAWRLMRWLWCALTTGIFLWFLRELRVSVFAAIATSALAIWNPFRGEIWTSLTLAEGVAMPYAVLGLVAVVRAAKTESRRAAWGWDAIALLSVLCALGCKNTFVALVPAQIILRLCPAGCAWREGWRRHRFRIFLPTLMIVPVITHYVWFKLHWHPGQYVTTGPSWAGLVRYLSGLKGALSVDFLAVGLILSAAAVTLARGWRELSATHGSAILAGIALALAGTIVYLPMDAVSGRYTLPAVWGLDMIIAIVLSAATIQARYRWRTAAAVGIMLGLTAVAVSNVGKQQKFKARAQMVWQVVEFLERNPLPPGSDIAWVADTATSTGGRVPYQMPNPGLNAEEGVHLDWHLQARRRVAVQVRLHDEAGTRLPGSDHRPTTGTGPIVVITADPAVPEGFGPGWKKKMECESVYWAGRKRYRCGIWMRDDSPPLAQHRTP